MSTQLGGKLPQFSQLCRLVQFLGHMLLPYKCGHSLWVCMGNTHSHTPYSAKDTSRMQRQRCDDLFMAFFLCWCDRCANYGPGPASTATSPLHTLSHENTSHCTDAQTKCWGTGTRELMNRLLSLHKAAVSQVIRTEPSRMIHIHEIWSEASLLLSHTNFTCKLRLTTKEVSDFSLLRQLRPVSDPLQFAEETSVFLFRLLKLSKDWRGESLQ